MNEGLWSRESGEMPNKWKKQHIKAKEKAYSDGWINVCMMLPVCVTEQVYIRSSTASVDGHICLMDKQI